MVLIKIPKNRMNYLIEQVQSAFSSETLEYGWDDYHKGRVQGLHLANGLELTANMTGKTNIRVSLHVDDFAKSACDCAKKEPCRHMAAVFFATYSAHGRPELLLMQLRTAIATRIRMQKTAAQKQARTQDKQLTELLPSQMPQAWQRFFEQRFNGYTLTQQNSIDLFSSMATETLKPFATNWPLPLKTLFELHIVWFCMRKIEMFADQNQSSYLSFHLEQSCRNAMSQNWRQLNATVKSLNAQNRATLVRDYPDHWNDTIMMAHEAIDQAKTDPISWLTVYRLLWRKLFVLETDIEAEKRRLGQRLAETNTATRRRDQIVHARAYFDMMAGDDVAAFKRYELLMVRVLPEFYDVLELLRSHAQWQRLQSWLRWLLPTLSRARQEEFQAVSGYWQEVVAHTASDEEWLAAMKAMLPRSYREYASYLLQKGRYRAWVDLQLSYGQGPSSLNPDELRLVESSAPELLLPLYHAAVEKDIQEKSRTAYASASRWLRKLQAIYKRLDRTHLWSVYMQRLVHKYARLRAFQDELKKGTWAP
jgi:hypothetical protein